MSEQLPKESWRTYWPFYAICIIVGLSTVAGTVVCLVALGRGGQGENGKSLVSNTKKKQPEALNIPDIQPPGSQKPYQLNPANFELGQVGVFAHPTEGLYEPQVYQILSDKKLVVTCAGFRWVVDDHSTKGMVDNQYITLPGLWEVADTAKVGGNTMFLVRQAK